MRKALGVFAVVVLVLMLSMPASPHVMAQATATRTPRPTPNIPPTIVIPTVALPSLAPVETAASSAINILATAEYQATAIGSATSLTTTTQITLSISASNPFSAARGMMAAFSEVPYVGLLAGWMFFALILMVAIEAIRLLVPFIRWVIDLIKLIPGL